MSTLGKTKTKKQLCERNKIRYDLQYLAKDYENFHEDHVLPSTVHTQTYIILVSLISL